MKISTRNIPYPYSAMIAICSDLDETPDRHTYFEIMRFLNTKQSTSIGPGAGLEIGNTIYFDMPNDQFAYWNTDDIGRQMVQALIKSGHIDCLHSYGDLATTRSQAYRNLTELNRNNCFLKVWVDHGTAITNFDSQIMKGKGDVPGTPSYHSDLTMDYGIKFVWRGRVTSIIGQNAPRSLTGIGRRQHLYPSSKTLLKELIKGLLGRCGSNKYKMHSQNNLLTRTNLRDGQNTIEFMRCNPHWGGVSSYDTSFGFWDVLTSGVIERLIERNAFCILYTHLGKTNNEPKIFSNKTIESFYNLAKYAEEKKILITTTKRLLEYCFMKDQISYTANHNGNEISIHISYAGDILDLQGLTIYTPFTNGIKLFFNKIQINNYQHNPFDETGLTSISIPWPKLDYPI
ncbi:hypothetical protein [Desulfopila aestuarii]|uniref:Uncharacterized protein n=1 Tax=Desulfopila aestuarii DSM 18488 TaxID=1121416 RepID=A0A1M7YFP2_9BACT|nr:hypothetical protein [Desulfopila aestuarii]SHO51467.1 hypothetical protein SAMN02745220_04026 [Desulfopila aestuarii DSM 18488]